MARLHDDEAYRWAEEVIAAALLDGSEELELSGGISIFPATDWRCKSLIG